MTHPVFNKFDPEAIARVKRGIRLEPEVRSKTTPPRNGATYRAAIRNGIKQRRAAFLIAKRLRNKSDD